MRVSVYYHAQLRHRTGRPREEFFLEPGTKVGDLIKIMAVKYPSASSFLLNEEGEIRRSLLVFVNEVQLPLDAALSDSSEVVFLTPISGGSPI